MKSFLITLVASIAVIMFSGCGEAEFVGGFASGVTAMNEMGTSVQIKFIEAVNSLEAEADKINEAAAVANGTVLLKPEAIEAYHKARDRFRDPTSWIALASLMFGSGAGTKLYVDRKKL